MDSFLARRSCDDDEISLLNNAFNGGPENEIILKIHSVDLTRRDINTLRNGVWLNDEVVSYLCFCFKKNYFLFIF